MRRGCLNVIAIISIEIIRIGSESLPRTAQHPAHHSGFRFKFLSSGRWAKVSVPVPATSHPHRKSLVHNTSNVGDLWFIEERTEASKKSCELVVDNP
jgi:hypothetical protein